MTEWTIDVNIENVTKSKFFIINIIIKSQLIGNEINLNNNINIIE